MSISRRALAATILIIALVAGVMAVSADGQKKKTYTLDVGDTQGIDSMNVTVGVSVPAYEAWNLQYATLTDKAASDFHTIPGLATSWKSSNGGKTWTYKLRPNMKWSDGKPLTSEDVVYTVNRSKKEEWINHSSVVANLTASAPDKDTVVLKSSVEDPKLPTMDVYIVPKHIFQKYDADAILKYDATDGVGSGPFVLEKLEKGQFGRFRANPNYYKGKPAIDKVVIRAFNNPDAMVAALKRGELDAAEDIPGAAFHQLEKDKNIQTIQGNQGAMNEFAVNGGDGLKKPHPALLDPRVRQAIAHAIDKKTIVDRVMSGLAEPAETLSTSPDTSWTPEIPADQVYDFDLAKSKQILDDAGYKDTNGDGIREMPGGGQPLKMRYAVRTEGDTAQPTAEFITGWLKDIGIATTRKSYDDSALTLLIGKGDYDMFSWGWTPFVDPDQMLSYFTCGQIASDPKNPTDYYNDANYCDKEYDKLYDQQKTELDKNKRKELVHEMLTRFQKNAAYDVLYTYPDLQGYYKGRFTGWTRQPAKTGPVLFSNSSPSYAVLKPVTASSSGGGGGSGGIIAIVVVGVLLVGGLILLARRRRTAYERE